MSQHPIDSEFSALSPFQLKDELIRSARDSTQQKAATHKFLNAGRGNPNWIATTPREAFFLLGQFALEESKRVWDEPDLGGMPQRERHRRRACATSWTRAETSRGADAAAARARLRRRRSSASTPTRSSTSWPTRSIGDNYPVPDRMLRALRARSCTRYLDKTMCDDRPPPGKFDLFAVEGGTAAMCYVFKSLIANGCCSRGDTIALGTPIFTPYLEIPHLDEFQLQDRRGRAERDGATGATPGSTRTPSSTSWRTRRSRRSSSSTRSNPASFAMRRETHRSHRRAGARRSGRTCIILTDDVYGTFVDGLPLAGRRAAAQHHPRLLVLEALRLHRLAAGRRRAARGQRPRPS